MKSLVAMAVMLLSQGPPDSYRSMSDLSVHAETIDGMQWWSVRADSVTLKSLLREVGQRSGRVIEGLSGFDDASLVTVSLTRRPLDQVLEYALGSLGMRFELRRDTITILPGISEAENTEDLFDFASAAWLRASTRFPGHLLASSARLSQGELAEIRGDLSAANSHYQAVIEKYPTSKNVPEAYMRSGRVLKRMDKWAEASIQFRELASLPEAVEYQTASRLELARCNLELGNPESARFILNALDTDYPTADPLELTERLLTRAECLNALGRPMEALRVIDQAQAGMDPLSVRDSLRIRAAALEGVGLPAEAGRAWLLYSREAPDERKVIALEQAARLALEADDELSALFVCREAEAYGLDEPLRKYWREARRRLGFEVDAEDSDSGLRGRIDSIERLIEAEQFEKASTTLEALFLGRGALPAAEGVRVCIAWAECVHALEGLEAAVETLSEVRPEFESLEDRGRLDVATAKLLEKNGQFDRAIDAYRGKY